MGFGTAGKVNYLSNKKQLSMKAVFFDAGEMVIRPSEHPNDFWLLLVIQK